LGRKEDPWASGFKGWDRRDGGIEMQKRFSTLLLLALPASGKSEIRKFMHTLGDKECLERFHVGSVVEVDDYPYVNLMRQVDRWLWNKGKQSLFFQSNTKPFIDPFLWGALIELINEDYDQIKGCKQVRVSSPSEHLFYRIDKACRKVHTSPKFGQLEPDVARELAKAMENLSRDIVDENNRMASTYSADKTIVIEFARGGADGSRMPLKEPFGYAYSLGKLSDEIKRTASIFYVFVTPEESRRKNRERHDPNDPDGILGHSVPEEVMLKDYGCDDIEDLMESSPKKGFVDVGGGLIPIVRFDNRVDKTSFVRKDRWDAHEIETLKTALEKAFDELWQRWLERG
jgi:hypothetical protein